MTSCGEDWQSLTGGRVTFLIKSDLGMVWNCDLNHSSSYRSLILRYSSSSLEGLGKSPMMAFLMRLRKAMCNLLCEVWLFCIDYDLYLYLCFFSLIVLLFFFVGLFDLNVTIKIFEAVLFYHSACLCEVVKSIAFSCYSC